MNARNGRIFGCNGRIFGYTRMPAGISFHVKRRIIAPFLPMFAHFTPILTPCTLLTTIVPLFDLIDLVKVIDATIFLGVPCAEKITRLWRMTAAPQAENFDIELQMRSAARFRDDGSSCARVLAHRPR